MPPPRPSRGNQATLTFNHRVTKPVPKSTKGVPTAPANLSQLAKEITHGESAAKKKLDNDVIEADEERQPLVAPERKKSEAELRADKVTSREISLYWREIEKGRRARAIHQEKLSLGEKILRYWDVSLQYGPSIGISRVKRWERAEKLGLHPPIEILAVLMKEERKGVEGIQRAHMDAILNPNPTGAN
ncbi:hypothetical protein GGS21DRAFT_153806 [Xylaria nigripes]|nr:hypothetical protein GGS21DRAFT_153806 [Xylaria nigripes]